MATDYSIFLHQALQGQYKTVDTRTDSQGRTISVVAVISIPILVSKPTTDIVVFGRKDPRSVELYGWLPCSQVLEAPKVRTKFAIMMPALIAMPDAFNFEEKCDHPAAFWEHALEAWCCFVCNRSIYDEYVRAAGDRHLNR